MKTRPSSLFDLIDNSWNDLKEPLRDFQNQVDDAISKYSLSGNVKKYGAKGDTVVVTDGSVVLDSDILNCTTSSPFVVGRDEGKKIDVNQSGDFETAYHVGGDGYNNQVGTIIQVNSSSQVKLSFAAKRTVSSRRIVFGTDDTQAILDARDVERAIYFPPGNFAYDGIISLLSDQVLFGEGKGVSIITQLGVERGTVGTTAHIIIPDGMSRVALRNLSLVGTNVSAIGFSSNPATWGELPIALKLGTGVTSPIEDVLVENCELSMTYAMGTRNDGDAEQSGAAPSVSRVRFSMCDFNKNGGNGANLHCGGGLLYDGCGFHGNAGNGAEQASSRTTIVNSAFTENREGALSIGGVGDKTGGGSLLRDFFVAFTRFEKNGQLNKGYGIKIGGNVQHVHVTHCPIRFNALGGIIVGDGTPEFAHLSNDIRISYCPIVSNQLVGSAFNVAGLEISGDGVKADHCDIFNDPSMLWAYNQSVGILVNQPSYGAQLLHNNVWGHTLLSNRQYYLNGNGMTVIDDNPGTIIYSDNPMGYDGTCDVAGNLVTWKSGKLFGENLPPGSIVTINGVDYPTAATTSPPDGTCDTNNSTHVVTRITGPSFDALWAGQYIQIYNVNYKILSVADADHMTVEVLYNPIGNQVGVYWKLYPGGTVLNLVGGGTTLINATFQIKAGFVFPAPGIGGALVITNGQILPTHKVHTIAGGNISQIPILDGMVPGSSFTVLTSAILTTDAINQIGRAIKVGANNAITFFLDGAGKWWPSKDNNFTMPIELPTSAGSALWAIDESNGTPYTINNGSASDVFGSSNNFSGMILIKDPSVTGAVGLFLVGGSAVALLGESIAGSFVASSTVPSGKIGVYLSSSAVRIENETGSVVHLKVFAIRMHGAL